MKENSHKNLHIKQERNEQKGKNKTGQNYLIVPKLNDGLDLPSIIRKIKSSRMRLVGHVARMRAMRNSYIHFVGEPEGKKSVGRPRRNWNCNIKTDLKETGCDLYSYD
jgi:hypothetical protein